MVTFAGDDIFSPVIIVEPELIYEDTEIMPGVDLNQTCLIPGINEEGLSNQVDIDGNNIDFIFLGSFFEPCTVIPTPEYYFYNIGSLPEGEYTITFFITGVLPVDPNNPNIITEQFGDPITFNVLGGSSSVAVPILSTWGTMLLVLAFLCMGYIVYCKKSKSLMLMSLVVIGFNVNANVYHVLLSSDPNAPTADEVMAESLISPAPPAPLISAFISAPPEEVQTLIELRATGHFLNVINNNPDWSYSKLYRYIVLTYPEGTDVESTRATLAADQYIDKVFVIDGDPAIVPLRSPEDANEVSPTKVRSTHQKFGVNSHLTDLNVISAWELSEGSGYIGSLDVGVQTDHPDLRAFDDLGNYTGGNLLDAFYQYDIGEGDFNVDSAQPTPTNGLPVNEGCDLADGVDDDMAVPTFLGHGTHMAGFNEC